MRPRAESFYSGGSDVRNHESLTKRVAIATTHGWEHWSGWRRALMAASLMAIASGFCVAQAQEPQSDADDAFLPSPVRSVSTVPKNGDVNPYGVVFVQNNFNTGAGHRGAAISYSVNGKQYIATTTGWHQSVVGGALARLFPDEEFRLGSTLVVFALPEGAR